MIYVSPQHQARTERIARHNRNDKLINISLTVGGVITALVALDTLNNLFNIILISQQ